MGNPRDGRARNRFASIAAIALLGTLLSGCTVFNDLQEPTDSSNSGSGQASIESMRPHHSESLLRYYDQTVGWYNCGGRYFCGSITVPLNWNKLGVSSISIALIEHRPKGMSEGDILVDPGGPGGSGTELVGSDVSNAVDSTLASRFDIVGFDPRGTGDSTAVRCFSNAGTDRYLYAIDPGAIGSREWVKAEYIRAASLAKSCQQNTGALLGQIDTVSAAKDMDVIRSALGDKKLNYLGYSYGTYLGTVYAGLYPKRVGRMVLDGADDPWVTGGSTGDDSGFGSSNITDEVDPSEDSTVAQAIGFEDDLHAYLRSCVANDKAAVGSGTCPFATDLQAAKSDVEADFAQVTKHPLVAGDDRRIGGYELSVAIDEALYDTSDWPHLTTLFTQLAKGTSTEAFTLADEYNDRSSSGKYYDNEDFANLAINCLEDGHSVDLNYDAAELKELRKDAPILGPYSAYGDIGCSGWKYGPSPFPKKIYASGTGPILVLGTTGDPATPYSEAKALASQLDGGHLVTLNGEGHTAYDLGNACIDSSVDRYVIAGTVPKRDPQCH